MTRLFNKTTQVTTITVGADSNGGVVNNWVIGALGQTPVFNPPADTPAGGFAALCLMLKLHRDEGSVAPGFAAGAPPAATP